MSLHDLNRMLQSASGLHSKRDVQLAAAHFPRRPALPSLKGAPRTSVPNGDDAAAIPDGDGHLLLAAEGLLPSFVSEDPWFAGFCSVMVNVSDISSMGGRAVAAVDVLFCGEADNDRVLEGMRAAADAFGVPVVGGHTGRSRHETLLSVAILGRAERLITSFDAKPGDDLLLAADLRGSYRGSGNNFNAATCASSRDLRSQHALLPELAESGLVHAGKDVSMAGIPGTLGMLCEASGCGATLDLDRIPLPANVPLARWLLSFPSFGFLLASKPDDSESVERQFRARGIACGRVGSFQAPRQVEIRDGRMSATYLDLDRQALTGFGSERHSPSEASAPTREQICL